MESPVVVDKPPEYHGNDRGFPFDEEEGAGAWSELASRHPDIAARLRQRPATWARKRRPSSQDATDDFGDSFGGFDRFPFDDIPPEFRDHFPSHWNRRFGPREEPQTQAAPQSPPAHQQTTATQTEQDPGPSEPEQPPHLPQYGLRNTVDLGQKSPADPSLVDADERNQRSMSAPPDSAQNQNFKMSGQNHHEQHQPHQAEQPSNVRHIPIFVEGRDEPVINKSVDHGTHFGENKQAYVPPPQPHIDREQYFADDGPVNFHHPTHFSRAYSTPFNKGYRQGPQPFVQQKVYPQAAFTRGASPQRAQSPKPQPHPEEHYVKVPVHHEQAAPKTEQPSRTQQKQPPHQQPPQQKQPPQQQPPQQKQPPQQQPPQQKQQSPPREQTPPQQSSANDPITLIVGIQRDVLNLMTEVENFTGTKKDKTYLFLDEMLTRNLIKLDNIETDGKENIRQARKEAIKCIQKCIAVLEAKADSNNAAVQPQTQDVEMVNSENVEQTAAEPVTENGEVEMKEETKEEKKETVEPQAEAESVVAAATAPQPEETKPETKLYEEKTEVKPEEGAVAPPPDNNNEQVADTRPEEKAPEQTENKETNVDKPSPKKGTKVVKKRNKSKDNKKEEEPKDCDKNDADSTKVEQPVVESAKVEVMQVDDKGDKIEAQVMDVDGAASQ